MYKKGGYITRQVNFNPGGGAVTILVNDGSWANIGDDVTIFSPEGVQFTAKVKNKNNTAIQVINYNNKNNLTAELYWGIRPVGNVPTTTAGLAGELDKAIKKAFGGEGNFGEDGGGFIEFQNINAGSSPVPFTLGGGKIYGDVQSEMVRLGERWFSARARKDNVMHLIYGVRLLDDDTSEPEPGGFAGLPSIGSNNVFLFLDAPFLNFSNVERAQATAHEMGHVFGVVNPIYEGDGKFKWVDAQIIWPAHDDASIDIMSYRSNRANSEVEFSTDINYHLRTRKNPDQ